MPGPAARRGGRDTGGGGRRTARRARHAVTLVAALAVGSGAIVALLDARDDRRITALTDATGYASLLLLALSLVIGPWNLLRRRPNPTSNDLRRDVGIAAGLTAVVHVVASLGVHLVDDHPSLASRALAYVDPTGPGVRFAAANLLGLAAAVLVVALTLTSSDLALRRLGGRRWKRVQRTNYVLAPLAALHTALYWTLIDRPPLVLALVGGALVLVAALQLAGVGRHRARRGERAPDAATGAVTG